MQVICPWEVNLSASRWKWAMGYLSVRGLPLDSRVYYPPTNEKFIEQVGKLTSFVLKSRNWIVCISESPSYMRDLFTYVMACYVFTTGDRAMIVDVDDLIEAADDYEGEKRDIVENADLLMICNCEPDNIALKWKKGTISNILQRRKYARRSTVIEMFSPRVPSPLPDNEREKIVMSISSIFGPTVYELFIGDRSKHVIVRNPRSGIHGRQAANNQH